jgi:hypothetical protein
MIEQAFLEAVETYLKAPGTLPVAQVSVGVAEPAVNGDLPAVVLSLGKLERLGSGLGERSDLMIGALKWTVKIDLANPVLPGDPSFRLLSQDGRTLSLPHGGLVKADGSTGAAAQVDMQVKVNGVTETLVAANPQVGQFTANLLEGRLVFGAALPGTGLVEATYFIGQWERRVMRMEGELNAGVAAADVSGARTLSDAVVGAMAKAPEEITGLAATSVAELGPVTVSPKDALKSRSRFIRFHFEYEFEINSPDSSGGIIREVPVTANLG